MPRFLIYEEMRKYFPIYEEAVSHIWLCNCSTLNFPIYEENLIFFFIIVRANSRMGLMCLTMNSPQSVAELVGHSCLSAPALSVPLNTKNFCHICGKFEVKYVIFEVYYNVKFFVHSYVFVAKSTIFGVNTDIFLVNTVKFVVICVKFLVTSLTLIKMALCAPWCRMA